MSLSLSKQSLDEMYLKIEARKKRYSCRECGQGCATPAALEIHQYIHSGLKPYSCSICNKGFSQSGSLNRHKTKYH